MAEISNERMSLETRASELGLPFDETTNDADLGEAVTAAELADKHDQDAKRAARKQVGAKYYKSSIHGLAIADGNAFVAPARFVAYQERYQGDLVKIGYLETSDPAIQDILADDPNVEAITAAEFKKATGADAVLAAQ